MSFLVFIPVLYLMCHCAVILTSGLRLGAIGVFSPLFIYALLILYYCVIGPLVLLANGDTIFFGIDVGLVFWKGWIASCISLACFHSAYYLYGRHSRFFNFTGIRLSRASDQSVVAVCTVMFGLAAVAMIFWVAQFGGGLSFFSVVRADTMAELSDIQMGGLATYSLQFVNMSFGACILLLLLYLDKRNSATLGLFIVVVLLSLLFFVKTGFRYRIAWMALGLSGAYFLWTKRRPSLILGAVAGGVFLLLMGFIGLTRNYFSGLDFENARGVGVRELAFSGLAEASTFVTLSQVVDVVPRELSHTYFDPLWVAVTYPIPRALWPGKPDSETLRRLGESFGGVGAAEAGQAVPYFGEWYIAFGWVGVACSAIVFGIFSKILWLWMKDREKDKLAIVIYCVGLGFVYVAFSRGLFAQALLNFSFSILPLLIVYRYLGRSMKFVARPGRTVR